MSDLLNPPEVPRSRFLTSIATILGGQLATIALALLNEVCVARLLGPAARGQISLFLMAVWFSAMLGGLGGDVPIVLWSAGHNHKFSRWLSVIFLWGVTGACLTVYVWTLVFSRWHSSLFHGVTPELARLVSLSIPLAILFSYMIALLTGAERFGPRASVTLLRSAAGLAGLFAMVWLYGRNASAALWG